MSTVTPKFKFEEGEKVLCFHGPLLYEAKCIKHRLKDKNAEYFIHYSGWNKNWDEWVPESRVLKHNEANLQKQKELEKAHVKSKKGKLTKFPPKKEEVIKDKPPVTPSQEKPKQKTTTPPPPTLPSSSSTLNENASDALKKKRTRAEQNVETEEEYVQKVEIKVRIPDELKIWLVDDWDLVSRQRKLVHLPARSTVENILANYLRTKTAEKGMTSNKMIAITEAMDGLREYFNVMLGKQLLYKFERQQYQSVLSNFADKPMSEIYGAIHLLRMFAKIGTVLAYTALDSETVVLLMIHFQDFVKYMSKPSQNLFSLSDYELASPEYHRKAT